MTITYAPGTPNWVDLGTTDIAGAAAFYGSLFGWTHLDLGEEMGNYGFFLQDGKQVGGVGPATDPSRGATWATYFAVSDVDAVAKAVEANGGTVVTAPMDVADQGRMAVFTDSGGQFFSAWQPGNHKGAEVVNVPGTISWNELSSADIEAAKSFYPAVLGDGVRDVDMGGGMIYTLLTVDGRSVAGAMQAAEGQPTGWSVYFEVADCRASYAQAVEFGAQTFMEPTEMPPGVFSIMTDPQGAMFCIIQSNPDFSA